MQRKDYLDTVRALAAFLVVAVHTQLFFNADGRLMMVLASMGQLGVQLFFTLSAFLIFASLDGIRKRGGTVVEFFVHRFLRIAPLYYFAIAVYVAVNALVLPALGVSPHAPETYTFGNFAANFLFLHGFVPAANNSIVGGGWSIGTECAFYAMAPALFLARFRPGVLLLIGAACFPLVFVAARTLQGYLGEPQIVTVNGFLYYSILNQLPVFLCGCLLFIFRERLFRLRLPVALAGWILPLVAIYFAWTRYFGGTMTFAVVPLLAGISSAFLIVAAQHLPRAPWLVTEFGRRAFSIYLFNLPALLLVRYLSQQAGLKLPFLVALPLVAAAAFCGAGVTWRFVEKPFIEIAKRTRFPGRGGPSPASPGPLPREGFV